MKKTNIKIKKSKINIYNKRKNKTKRTVSLVVTIVLACVLGVVGYGVGVPIVNYFNEKKAQTDNNSSSPADSTPSSSESGNSTDATSENSTSTSGETSEPEPVVEETRMYVLPITATASTEALNSALAVAKEAGYNCAAVTLKDDTGILHYKSEIPRIKNEVQINKGTLSAQQICDIIKKAGLTPAARINTLKDHITPNVFGSYTLESGVLWLDNAANAGGKLWLSPFEESTVSYIGELTEELSAAGFKNIVCTNIRYPSFHGMDKDTWLKHLDLRNDAKRLKALWAVVDKANAGAAKNGAKLWVEMSGVNLINPEKSFLDSELAFDTEKLKTLSIIVDYEAGADVSEVYLDAKTFAENVKAAAGGAELVVMTSGSLKGSALADAERAFAEAGLKVFAAN